MDNSSAYTITAPKTDEFDKRGAQIVQQANALIVVDDKTFQDGGAMLTTIKTISNNLEAEFKEPVKKAHEAHKSLVALRDKALFGFKQAETIIKTKLGVFQAAQEAKRRAEYEAKLKAERERLEAERMAKAQEQMDKGDLEACQKTLEAPAPQVVSVQVETPAAPKIAGVSFREDFDFEVSDVDAIPREYMIPDSSVIRKIVKSQGKACRIPGIVVLVKQVVAAGGRVA